MIEDDMTRRSSGASAIAQEGDAVKKMLHNALWDLVYACKLLDDLDDMTVNVDVERYEAAISRAEVALSLSSDSEIGEKPVA